MNALAMRFAIFGAVLALAGCSSSPEGGGGHPDYDKALAGAPPRLAALHAQANKLLPGGLDGYERRIASLRGYPIVVNVWASWCGPCRLEFPAFQQLSTRYGKRVAFLGVNSQDSAEFAERFLREEPVPYPSYTDPDEDIAESIGASRGLPATAFYDRQGELLHFTYVPYTDHEDLRSAIERCALGSPPNCEGG
jgi:cytochrome c biogenesis protein CcmG/thiol:disulfide interchange protein DsbE